MTDIVFDENNVKKSPLVLLLCKLIFASFICASFATAFLAFKPIRMSIHAHSWQQAPAVITLHYIDARKNRYSIRANYTYTWEGNEYNSNQIFFDETVGIRKDYYTRIYHEFSNHTDSKNPIMIWVNPNQPQQAVIFKYIRWDKFVFSCLIVFGLIFMSLVSYILLFKVKRKQFSYRG